MRSEVYRVTIKLKDTLKTGAIVGFFIPIVIYMLYYLLYLVSRGSKEVMILAGVLEFIAILPAHLLLITLQKFGIPTIPAIAIVAMFAIWAFIGAVIGYLIDKLKVLFSSVIG